MSGAERMASDRRRGRPGPSVWRARNFARSLPRSAPRTPGAGPAAPVPRRWIRGSPFAGPIASASAMTARRMRTARFASVPSAFPDRGSARVTSGAPAPAASSASPRADRVAALIVVWSILRLTSWDSASWLHDLSSVITPVVGYWVRMCSPAPRSSPYIPPSPRLTIPGAGTPHVIRPIARQIGPPIGTASLHRSTPAVALKPSQPYGVPNGYSPHHSTGVGCPAWGSGLIPQEASAGS